MKLRIAMGYWLGGANVSVFMLSQGGALALTLGVASTMLATYYLKDMITP